ncbi:LysR family transcriptional regulator [Mitsuokella sp. WILCCON 0060]|uniref:LysR family transcriptional regulator n=1 Tax=Mitsuokella sp. WILCCON 0060 TaxID=3345341 RepID=UPI003F1DB92B
MIGELPSIQQMECFIIYGRVQNFTRAAKEANITQSAFSAQMKNLENTLGVALIQRSKRGSHLTEAGEKFLKSITAWMEGLHRIVYELQNIDETQPVELNVGILRTLGDIQMNRHIAHFRQTNKNLRFNIFDLETDQINRALRDDRLDVVSTYFAEDSMPEGSADEFESAHFCWDNLVYYAPLLQPASALVTREEILSEPIVIYPKNYFMNKTFRRYFQGVDAGIKPVVSARLSTPYAMVYYCQQNEAGALLPERLLKTLGCKDGWYELAEPLRADACLLYKKNSPKIRQIRAYVNYVLESFAAEQDKRKE